MVNRTTTIWGPATLRGFQGSGWFYPIALILMFSALTGLVGHSESVDQLTLEVRRGDQTLAAMDWPQAGFFADHD